ncbi:MAG TPA: hypothetical protein VNB22_13695 [Pyrinomonadaceae bacterium]|nr:hypothetical protein [Pyrinomonadaceae bacterium]
MKPTILILITTFFVITGLAQKKETVSTDVRLIKDRPHVFISFQSETKVEPLYEGESGHRVWLQFHNNSRWKVKFCFHYVPEEYGKTGARYEIERYKGTGEVPSAGRSDTCRYSTLLPGKLHLFSVPREHLADGLAIKIQYHYAWEFDPDGTSNLDEPEHFVFFYSEDVPKIKRLKTPTYGIIGKKGCVIKDPF